MRALTVIAFLIVLLFIFAKPIIGLTGAIDDGLPWEYYMPYPVGYQGSPAQEWGIPFQRWEGLTKFRLR